MSFDKEVLKIFQTEFEHRKILTWPQLSQLIVTKFDTYDIEWLRVRGVIQFMLNNGTIHKTFDVSINEYKIGSCYDY